MKHKAKSFIAVLLALCLMMSLGVGALAVDGNESEISDGNTHGDDGPGDGDDKGGTAPSGDSVTDPTAPELTDPDDPGPQEKPGAGGGSGETGGDVEPTTESTTYSVTAQYNSSICSVGLFSDTNCTTSISQATADSTVYVKVTPVAGYKISNVQYNDGSYKDTTKVSDNVYSFKMAATPVYVAVELTKLYNISCQATGGTVTANPTTAAAGETVTLYATPSDLTYKLDALKVTQTGGTEVAVTNNTFTMPASDVTVTATFKKVEIPEPPVVETTHDVNIVDSTGGWVNANPDEAVEGATINLTNGSDYRHYFVGYNVRTASGQPVTVRNDSFTMPDEDVYVEGVFKLYQPTLDWHSIDVDKPYYSSVTVDSWAYETETVTFTVDTWYDYDYYSVSVWTDGGAKVSLSSLGNDKYSFTMPDDDVTIYVDYSYVGRYSITKDVEGDGSIYVRSSADHGDTVWIEAAPSAGQSLTSLRVFYGEPWAYGDKGYYGYWDEAEVKYSTYWDAYYFTMPADDVVVYARFTDGAAVDVITGDHADAKVSGRYAEKGDWVYITAYPDEGYEVDSVTVTDSLGRSVKVTELSYDYFLFTMPGTNVDVKVTFRAKDYDVFYDVSRGDWYYKAVRFVHEKGIMEGTGTHYFSPEADLSRGMLATILYRLEGSPAVSGYSGFADVADTAYYAKAVAWAKANGIVNGVTATAYEPDTAVTREELAAILCRYAAFKGKDTAISYDYLAGFSDANTSHVYARPALNWAVAYDIINGQGNGVLAPRATATRAEVAQVLMNYLEVFD